MSTDSTERPEEIHPLIRMAKGYEKNDAAVQAEVKKRGGPEKLDRRDIREIRQQVQEDSNE